MYIRHSLSPIKSGDSLPIAYNNRIYFSAPNGNPYQHKVYNPNNETTRLPYNLGQYYNEGTQKYYENLKGLNSSIFEKDKIIGKTVYTEHGRPITITEQSHVNIPQVKFDYGIPVKSDWNRMDYYDLDQNYINKTTSTWFKNNFNIPMEKDVKMEYRSDYKDDGALKPREINEETVDDTIEIIRDKIRNDNPAKILEAYLNKCDSDVEKFVNIKQKSSIPKKTKETFNPRTLNDTDILYKEMIRSYSKAISFYLNNNPKYAKWKKNWEILEKNLNKTNLLVERLDNNHEDIAYTENKGEVIRFRWRDNDKYLSKNVFMYVVLHELTHQVFPNTFKGHDEPFPSMLCILCVAGLELDLYDLSKIPHSMIYTNGQPIGSKKSLKEELNLGIDLLKEQNPESETYYENLRQYVNSK